MNLQEMRTILEEGTYGMSKAVAHENQICLQCKRPIFNLLKDAIDSSEYKISGICPECFDKNCEN